MAFYKAPSVNFFNTTLNGSINDSVDTITLNSVTGLQAPGVLIINREDGNGTATPSAREVISFTGISGSDLTGVTRNFDGSGAKSHANGSLVEATFTVGMWNDLRSAVAASLTTDGGGIALSGTASIATMRFVTGDIVKVAITSVVSAARLEASSLLAASVASIALPDRSVSGRHRQMTWKKVTSGSHVTVSNEYKDLLTTNLTAAQVPCPSVLRVSAQAWAWGTTAGRGSMGVRIGGAANAAYDSVDEIVLAGFPATESQSANSKPMTGISYVCVASGLCTVSLVGRVQDSGFVNFVPNWMQIEVLGS